jgi:hypothetical protein
LKLQRVEIIQVDVPPLNFPHPTDAHEHQKFMRKYEEEYLSRYVMFLFVSGHLKRHANKDQSFSRLP